LKLWAKPKGRGRRMFNRRGLWEQSARNCPGRSSQ